MKTRLEKYRILLSRLAAGLLMFLMCATRSQWESTNEIVTFSLFFTGIILVAISSLGRMWCSLYIAGYKDQCLINEGPYSLCRNPLYLFSMIGALGVGLATETLTFPVILLLIFALYYPFVIRGEESRLRQLFGGQFDEYARLVPRFFPRFGHFLEPQTYTVNPARYRTHMFSALWFVWIVGILEVIEGLREIGIIRPLWVLY